MKKMFNKMSNTVKTMICKAHCAMTCARAHLSAPLCNTRGEGYTVLEVDCYEEVPCNEKDCAHHRWRDPAPDGGRHSSAPVEAEQKGQIGPGVMPGLSDPT